MKKHQVIHEGKKYLVMGFMDGDTTIQSLEDDGGELVLGTFRDHRWFHLGELMSPYKTAVMDWIRVKANKQDSCAHDEKSHSEQLYYCLECGLEFQLCKGCSDACEDSVYHAEPLCS